MYVCMYVTYVMYVLHVWATFLHVCAKLRLSPQALGSLFSVVIQNDALQSCHARVKKCTYWGAGRGADELLLFRSAEAGRANHRAAEPSSR